MPENKKMILYIDLLGKILDKLPIEDVENLNSMMCFYNMSAIKGTIKTYLGQKTNSVTNNG